MHSSSLHMDQLLLKIVAMAYKQHHLQQKERSWHQDVAMGLI